jgi:hypothetical protein
LSGGSLEKSGYAALVLALPMAGVAILGSPACSGSSWVLACGLAALAIYLLGAVLNALDFRRRRSVIVALICLLLSGALATSLLNALAGTVAVEATRC